MTEMQAVLATDFGSTYTKVALFDLAREEILATARAPKELAVHQLPSSTSSPLTFQRSRSAAKRGTRSHGRSGPGT